MVEKQKENENIIKIDGSILEGGGQILRLSVSLSYLLNKNIDINKIRGLRNIPGLQKQHYAGLKFLEELYQNSKFEGLNLNSSNIILFPNNNDNKLIIKNNDEKLQCKLIGAGSIGLIIQQILPCLLFTENISEKKIFLQGGTLTSFSPSTLYIEEVLFKILKKMNINCSIKTINHGLYPQGGGKVLFNVEKMKEPIKNIDVLNRGKLLNAKIRFCVTQNYSFNSNNLIKSIFKEVKKIIRNECQNSGNEENYNNDFIEQEIVELPKNSVTFFYQCILIYENTIITSEYLFSEKREKEKGTFEKINNGAIENTENLINNDKICFDQFTVDHLIIFMALAKGKSKISVGKISLHTETAINIIKTFLPNINIKITQMNKNEKYSYMENNIIEIDGIGYI